MKLARLLLIVALFGVSWSVAYADGTDPKMSSSGCGATGQPPCDAFYLTPPGSAPNSGPPASGPAGSLDNVTFNFIAADDPSNPYGVTAAWVDVVNLSGGPIGSFVFNLNAEDSSGETLSYSCGTPPEGSTGSFPTCTPLGGDVFQFTGAQLCSVPTTTPVIEADFLLNPTCQYGERFILEATTGDPTDLAGQSVGATFYAPEPPSGLLLLIGLAAGAFVLRKRSLSLA